MSALAQPHPGYGYGLIVSLRRPATLHRSNPLNYFLEPLESGTQTGKTIGTKNDRKQHNQIIVNGLGSSYNRQYERHKITDHGPGLDGAHAAGGKPPSA